MTGQDKALVCVAALTIFAVTGLAGCASGPPFKGVEPAPPGKAVVYVYRPAAFPQAVNRYAVRFDRGFAMPVELGNGSWARFVVDPGSNQIRATGQVMFMTCAPTAVDLKADDVSFVELSVRMWGDGRQNYQSCKLAVANGEEALRSLAGLPEAGQ